MASRQTGPNSPHGSTGINFPRPGNEQRPNGAQVTPRSSDGATNFIFVPVERRTIVPVPVPVRPSFQLGKVAPTWTPDDKAPSCIGCGVCFSFTNRRHHCRACGKVFCSACSSKKKKLSHLGNNEARVCDFCFKELSTTDRQTRGVLRIFLF